jgi:hypothetical protein
MTTIRVGDLIMRETSDPLGGEPRLRIVRADPLIAVSLAWSDLIKCHMLSAATCDFDASVTIRDGVLTFYPYDGPAVIYRQVAWDEDSAVYLYARD